jgi:hypothetical protein
MLLRNVDELLPTIRSHILEENTLKTTGHLNIVNTTMHFVKMYEMCYVSFGGHSSLTDHIFYIPVESRTDLRTICFYL